MPAPEILKNIIATSTYFNRLSEKDENALYLLQDTKEIYKGDKKCASNVNFVKELPNNPEINQIYVDIDTCDVKIWDGKIWQEADPESIVDLDDDVENQFGIPTGEAVKDYVKETTEDMIESSLSWTEIK